MKHNLIIPIALVAVEHGFQRRACLDNYLRIQHFRTRMHVVGKCLHFRQLKPWYYNVYMFSSLYIVIIQCLGIALIYVCRCMWRLYFICIYVYMHCDLTQVALYLSSYICSFIYDLCHALAYMSTCVQPHTMTTNVSWQICVNFVPVYLTTK